jgi:CHASE2 domain-containing sensor protein
VSATPQYWFRAKRYGWGWGLPLAWQGWLVLAVFFASLLVGTVAILPQYGPRFFFVYALVLTVALLGVCWLKGEPGRKQ